MGLFEPLLIAVGIAGVIFMIYAFNAMKLLKGWTRILAISTMMLVTVLMSSRLLNNRTLEPNAATNSLWDLLPGQETIQDPGLAQTGWQDLPFDIVFGILLDAFDSAQQQPQPQPSVSPLPASPLPPSPSPIIPASPSPTAPPTVIQPAPQPSPVQPSPQPSPQPTFQPNPIQPYIQPSPQPSPTQPPVSAWW